MEKIGLIAGNRRFPLIVAQAAARQSVPMVAVGIRGETDPAIKKYVEKLYWVRLGDFQKVYQVLKADGVEKVIMAGQVSPWRLFSPQFQQSPQIRKLLAGIKDWRANTIFAALAAQLESQGFELLDSTTFVKDSLPAKGVLTRTQPDPAMWEDIRFGTDIARKVAGLDIGLSVGIRQKAVVAVEALEGTDNLIRRAGSLARKGVVIVKVGRPGQDMRFDIPVIGIATIRQLKASRASCMAIEAQRTLVIDLEACVSLADRCRIALVAV
ncbi:MAG: UDP-2,3-diacylglucosamine diphosphatase LpxI [Candidatus Omnitrophica bacterium]|nr:UDP-2,3-diacylglucosamine diphosphatase LpxI [Candidatus Omnitrophota bacterium]